MTDNQMLSYNVDITMCIDKTGSMKDLLSVAKENARSLYEKFVEKMSEERKHVEELRIRVIGFGDFGCDARPMMISRFFVLPAENDAFQEFLDSIRAEGGGDLPENGLEALAHAIKSDWTEDGDVRRHIIMLFTDTNALELGTRTDFSKADEQLTMPANLAELSDWWDAMEERARRLIIFAPDANPWTDIAVSWNNVIHVPSKAGMGCEDVDFEDVIRVLVQSVGTVAEQ